MRLFEDDECKLHKEEIKQLIMDNKVFIYPTDTIYGIGCDATSESAVKKIREIKQRPKMPFSVIAPSKEWIKENLELNGSDEWLDKLPGSYTLILNVKNKGCIAPETNPDIETLGVRIPNHWISDLAAEIGKPIVTTSANVVGKEFMKCLESLDPEVKSKVDFILYEGCKDGNPSKVVDLSSGEAVTVRS